MNRLHALVIGALVCLLSSPPPAHAQSSGGSGSLLPHRPSGGTPVDPNKLTPQNFKSPKLRGWINDVPDTGQFLPDSTVILRVGPRVTTVGDFIREYYVSYPEYRPGVDSAGRATFLKSLMNRDVLGLTALAQNRARAFEDRVALREARQRLLAQAVYRRFVQDSLTVTEPEMRRLWESYGFLQHFRHILLEDRPTAERVRRELISGRVTWAAAVKKYSIAVHDAGADGDLGWITPDKLDPGMTFAIYPLKPGETSQPVADRDGWHIVQSVERKSVPTPDYTALRPGIRNVISSAKQNVLGERLMAMLRQQNGVVFDTAAATFASTRFKQTMQVNQETTTPEINIDATPPEFTAEDTARVIARWKGGGRFSIGDLTHAYNDIPPIMRPTLNRPEAVLGFVQSIVLEPYIAEYGAQQGLERDPIVERPMQRKLEELMVEHMYQDSIGTRIWVSKDERKAYYEKNKPQFFTYASVDFAAIVRESKAGADSVERMLRGGLKAADLLRSDSLAGRMSGTIQHRVQNEQGPYQKALFEEMRPGDIQVRGPDRKGDYAILQLLKYDGGRQLPYEEVESLVDESLQNIKSEQALDAMIARLKQRYPIEAHFERLMLVRMADPSLDS